MAKHRGAEPEIRWGEERSRTSCDGTGDCRTHFPGDYATRRAKHRATDVLPAPWYDGGHLLAPSGTMNLPDGYFGRWCCACGAILKKTPNGAEAFEAHLESLRASATLEPVEQGLGTNT